MAAPIVYSDVAEGANLGGQLFAGKNFWVAQRVPSRAHYLDLIRSNGGVVVLLEKRADYLIADHLRRDSPPGSVSFTFIDKSIKNGAIADPEAHLAGPPVGSVREVGSISRPTKQGRAEYTAEEDRILYKWVRDHERQGGSASGNVIYKQLEVQHPRHTWQSWRDRYVKQLRNRPPAGLDVPENAPPSPPSDQSVERMPPARPVPKTDKRPVQTQSVTKAEHSRASVDNKLPPSVDAYTVDDFDKIFATSDWEELYANVEVIQGIHVTGYIKGWQSWAKGTSQTAEQWRQYFEKIVLPQWEQDGSAKKKTIKDRVARRHDPEKEDEGEDEVDVEGGVTEMQTESPAVLGPSTPTPKRKREQSAPVIGAPSEDALVEQFLKERGGHRAQDAYMFWAREKRLSMHDDDPPGSSYSYEDIQRTLKPQWDALSAEEKAPYLVMEAADKRRYELQKLPILSSAARSSTIIQDTPDYIKNAHEKIMKRIFDGDQFDETPEETTSPKRQKLEHPVQKTEGETHEIDGTQGQPLEISSGESSFEESSQELGATADDQAQVGVMEDVVEDDPNAQKVSQSVEKVQYPNLERLATPTGDIELEPPSSSNFPSNTPTPRAPRQRSTAFDTQAILSSPSQSQAFRLAPLPRPAELREASHESAHFSSDLGHQESEASTTHSIQEFRRSLNADENEPSFLPQGVAPLPRPARELSLNPSETDSDASGDPDPPLNPAEMEVFFEEQRGNGFTDEEITEALKHTRCRPELAAMVLEAWKDRKPLPNTRGVWSIEDDEIVQSGNAVQLAELEMKHSMEGWGGVTERLRYLEQWRGKR